jgi:hypothetical protein
VPSRFPSKLYKYVPAARIDILKNARVRFTPPVVFNDLFEMLPVLTRVIFASNLENHHLKTGQGFNEYVQQAFAEDKTHGETIRAQIGVLSLTAEPGSLLMWAHYADHHRGFAIEFDALHSFLHQRQLETRCSRSSPTTLAIPTLGCVAPSSIQEASAWSSSKANGTWSAPRAS